MPESCLITAWGCVDSGNLCWFVLKCCGGLWHPADSRELGEQPRAPLVTPELAALSWQQQRAGGTGKPGRGY